MALQESYRWNLLSEAIDRCRSALLAAERITAPILHADQITSSNYSAPGILNLRLRLDDAELVINHVARATRTFGTIGQYLDGPIITAVKNFRSVCDVHKLPTLRNLNEHRDEYLSGRGKKKHLTTGSYYSVGVFERQGQTFFGVFGHEFPLAPLVDALEAILATYESGIIEGQPVKHLKS